MEADSLKADNKKIWIRGQFVEVTDGKDKVGYLYCECNKQTMETRDDFALFKFKQII